MHQYTKFMWSIIINIQKGCTSLYLASQQGHKEVVELLLDRGASVDKPNMVTYKLALPKLSEKVCVFHTAIYMYVVP